MRAIGFGPWVSSLDCVTTAELSRAWKWRLSSLVDSARSRGVSSRRACVALALVALTALLSPIVELAPAAAPSTTSDVDAAKVAKAPALGQPLRIELPGGGVAELVAVGWHPSAGKSWWGPDGHPAPAPYHQFRGAVQPDKSEFVREIAFRWVTKPENVDARWSIVGGGSESGGRPVDASGKSIDNLWVKAHAFPSTAKTCQLRFDVGLGGWKTIAVTDGRSDFSIGTQGHTVAFAAASMRSTGLTLTAAHTVIDDNIRLVAINQEDEIISAPYSSSGGGRGFLQTTVSFPNLQLGNVKEFRLEARPYQSIEVRNISLIENEFTQPEVVVLPAGAQN
jgi:hypothetical protein